MAKPIVVVTYRMPVELKENIEADAARRECSEVEIVREILINYYEKRDKKVENDAKEL